MTERPFLRTFTTPAALCALGFAAAMAAVLQYSLRAYVPGSLDPGGFTLANFADLLKPLYARVFFDTVVICAVTAIATLIVGYPLAYALVHIEQPILNARRPGGTTWIGLKLRWMKRIVPPLTMARRIGL